MKLWRSERGFEAYVPLAMARLARLPQRAALLRGLAVLVLIVALDGAVRPAGLRLVPLYVPLLCVMSWALSRRRAILFAIVAAIVALLPDMMAASNQSGAATAFNAVVRAATYIFLALIIAAYRRAYDEADYRAMYDGLTGALNKMPFQSAVVRHLAAARRSRQTMLAACIDLDGFKGVNSNYGHAAGDAALCAFSAEAMRAVRGSDLVGRLGGDEFGFLLGASSAQNAEALAHLLHQRVTTTLAKSGLPLSCSMGALVVGPDTSLTEAELFERADGLMRQAKADGKGKVLTESAPGGIA
jgi:diguanylate cyclase (GGDEF)-like protein